MNKQVTKTQFFGKNYFRYFENPSHFYLFLGYFLTLRMHFYPKNEGFFPQVFLGIKAKL